MFPNWNSVPIQRKLPILPFSQPLAIIFLLDPHFQQHLLLSDLLSFAYLVGAKYYFIVILCFFLYDWTFCKCIDNLFSFLWKN